MLPNLLSFKHIHIFRVSISQSAVVLPLLHRATSSDATLNYTSHKLEPRSLQHSTLHAPHIKPRPGFTLQQTSMLHDMCPGLQCIAVSSYSILLREPHPLAENDLTYPSTKHCRSPERLLARRKTVRHMRASQNSELSPQNKQTRVNTKRWRSAVLLVTGRT